MLRRAKVGL